MVQEHAISCPLTLRYKDLFKLGVDHRGGCYAVFHEEECLYVGCSFNVLTRILAHWNRYGWMCSNAYFEKQDYAPEGSELRVWFSEDYSSLEKQLIWKYSPIFNKQRYETLVCPIGRLGHFPPMLGYDSKGKLKRAFILSQSKDGEFYTYYLEGNSYLSTWKSHKSWFVPIDPLTCKPKEAADVR